MSNLQSNDTGILLPGDHSQRQEKVALALLLLASTVAFFFQLGGRSFENQCYIRYAEVAREMIRSGDWVVLRLHGELFLHKPPLIVWLIGIPSALVGKVTPLCGRLPSALSAVAGIGLAFYLGKRLFHDYRVGLLSGLVLLSSKEYFWQARIARTDMLLTFFILAALTCFYLAYESSGRNRFWLYVLFFAFMALGTLTKGPPGILFPFGTAALFLLFKRKLRSLYEPGFLLGAVVFALIVFPWILLYFYRVGLHTFLSKFSVGAVLTRPEPFYYYVLQFWPRFFPWALFIPSAILFLSRKDLLRNDATVFLLCWVGLVGAVISPMHNKSYRYLLPAFPALALILGGAWKEVYGGMTTTNDRMRKWWNVSTRLCLTIFVIAYVAGPIFTWYHTHSLGATVMSLLVLVLGGVVWLLLRHRAQCWAHLILISCLSLLAWETYFFFITREDRLHSPIMVLAQEVGAHVNKGNLATFEFDKALGLDFYLDAVIPELESPAAVKTFLTEPGKDSACLMTESGYQLIAPQLQQKHLEVQRIPSRKRTYYLLISRKKPPVSPSASSPEWQ